MIFAIRALPLITSILIGSQLWASTQPFVQVIEHQFYIVDDHAVYERTYFDAEKLREHTQILPKTFLDNPDMHHGLLLPEKSDTDLSGMSVCIEDPPSPWPLKEEDRSCTHIVIDFRTYTHLEVLRGKPNIDRSYFINRENEYIPFSRAAFSLSPEGFHLIELMRFSEDEEGAGLLPDLSEQENIDQLKNPFSYGGMPPFDFRGGGGSAMYTMDLMILPFSSQTILRNNKPTLSLGTQDRLFITFTDAHGRVLKRSFSKEEMLLKIYGESSINQAHRREITVKLSGCLDDLKAGNPEWMTDLIKRLSARNTEGVRNKIIIEQAADAANSQDDPSFSHSSSESTSTTHFGGTRQGGKKSTDGDEKDTGEEGASGGDKGQPSTQSGSQSETDEAYFERLVGYVKSNNLDAIADEFNKNQEQFLNAVYFQTRNKEKDHLLFLAIKEKNPEMTTLLTLSLLSFVYASKREINTSHVTDNKDHHSNSINSALYDQNKVSNISLLCYQYCLAAYNPGYRVSIYAGIHEMIGASKFSQCGEHLNNMAKKIGISIATADLDFMHTDDPYAKTKKLFYKYIHSFPASIERKKRHQKRNEHYASSTSVKPKKSTNSLRDKLNKLTLEPTEENPSISSIDLEAFSSVKKEYKVEISDQEPKKDQKESKKTFLTVKNKSKETLVEMQIIIKENKLKKEKEIYFQLSKNNRNFILSGQIKIENQRTNAIQLLEPFENIDNSRIKLDQLSYPAESKKKGQQQKAIRINITFLENLKPVGFKQ